MALDAFVYCDCYEKDSLRCEPPHGVELKVAPTGELTCQAGTESAWSAFQAWKLARACLHHGMILKRHRLGNDQRVELIRGELQKEPRRYPILLKHVVYSSTHTCDWIPFEWLPHLIEEVKDVNPGLEHTLVADALRQFKIQVAELVIAAQMTGKPICF